MSRLPRGFRLAVLVSTVLVLLAELICVYGVRFRELVHSDAAVPLLMTRSALESHAAIPTRWYWANGDVWFLQLPFTWLPTMLGGVGIAALRVFDLVGFGLELLLLDWCFRQLGARRWVAVLAAFATLLGISRLHLHFVYVEITYAFVLVTYLFAFVTVARLLPLEGEPVPRVRWLVAAITLAVVTSTNPMRFVAFGLLPLVAVGLWPWRGLGLRARGELLALIGGSFACGYAVYRLVLRKELTFATAAHDAFVLRDAHGIRENLAMLGRGVLALTGELPPLSLASLPGLVLVGGALAATVAHIFSSRTLTRTRLVALVLVVATGAITVPLIAANFMLTPMSAHYLMPAVLPMLGLTVVLVADRIDRLSNAWLCLLPLTGLVGFLQTTQARLETESAQWANEAGHHTLASELAARGLRHGFATYWHASIFTLLSNEATRVCPLMVGDDWVMPYRWAVATSCFDRDALSDDVFFVTAPDQKKFPGIIQGLFGPPREHFTRDGFQVFVYAKAALPLDWLDMPLPSGDAIRFPFELRLPHVAMHRGAGVATSDGVLATGEGGAIVFGPYIDLPRGHYRLTWFGHVVDSPGAVAFDVHTAASDVAATGAATSALAGKTVLAELPFVLPADTPGVELRVHSQDGGKVVLERLRLERE